MGDVRWLPVVGYEDCYEVSDSGEVRSLRAGRTMKPSVGNKGHLRVTLSIRGKSVGRWVHRLVLAAFVGPLPDGLETRHLNGNPADNRLSNLAYGTHSENMRDAVRHGTHNMTRKTHCKNGHEFTPENTYVTRTGFRDCRACNLARWHERRRRYAFVGPANADKTHCKNGHPFDADNTRLDPLGKRVCIECARLRSAQSGLRRKSRKAAEVGR